MGKSKTAQRQARAAGEVAKQLPLKPKLHAWYKHPAYHQFDKVGDTCVHCGLDMLQHCLPNEGQVERRWRLQ